ASARQTPYKRSSCASSFSFVSLQHPRVLRASTLGGVDDERALAQRDAREAAGCDGDFVAEKNVGPQIDVAALELAVAPRRRARQHDGVLCDEVARVGGD